MNEGLKGQTEAQTQRCPDEILIALGVATTETQIDPKRRHDAAVKVQNFLKSLGRDHAQGCSGSVRTLIERCIAICLEEAEEWDSDRLQNYKNYAGHCANRISDEVLAGIPAERSATKLPEESELPRYPSNEAREWASDAITAMSEEHYGEEKSYLLAQYFHLAFASCSSPAASANEPADEFVDAFLKAEGSFLYPYTAPRESGVPIECDITKEDADELNAEARAKFKETWRAAVASYRPSQPDTKTEGGKP